ncbi:hypothetical protein Pjdr2_0246 [Paenibacillus sp. JDR-2]|nr:hypothetical protein Pjdr2_0246 [Paenibacillus sp. JDR-2]
MLEWQSRAPKQALAWNLRSLRDLKLAKGVAS